MGKRKGKCAKKNAATKGALEPEHLVKAPHSFVIHRGKCSKDLMDLTKDFRKIMEPFTASQLKERKKNTIKDFLSISGYLHVSHMMLFTETELGSYMRLARMPRGPTLTFRIHNVKLKNIRRCVLMNYNPSSKLIDLRHYVIRAIPVGLNKGTKKMVQGKIPNLNRCKDMSEFFDKAALMSESEFEDDGNQVELPQALASRGASAKSKSALRLVELGPRMVLQLIKVEDGLMDGEVLFHELVEKTDQEKALIKKKREEKRRLKEKRKAQQDDNVKRKEKEKEELKQKALEGIKKKKDMTENQRLMELAAAETQNASDMEQDDNDADYYREEVGAEPEHDLFTQNPPRKRKSDEEGGEARGFKKMRLDKKLKKKYQNKDASRPQNDKRPKRNFQNQKDGGKNFQNRDDRKRNYQNKGDRRNSFQNKDDKRKNFRGQDDKKFNRNNQSGKTRKVFGGKFNKMGKMGKSRQGKTGKGKGKSKK
ncbi:protein Peter pan isoform X2 [Maniola hyperantus]|uniref:protein Peter pan isoform X2 n=1 Tax=Aphantopus hyperantus TaxID=2795564 RepID=UPI0021261D50